MLLAAEVRLVQLLAPTGANVVVGATVVVVGRGSVVAVGDAANAAAGKLIAVRPTPLARACRRVRRLVSASSRSAVALDVSSMPIDYRRGFASAQMLVLTAGSPMQQSQTAGVTGTPRMTEGMMPPCRPRRLAWISRSEISAMAPMEAARLEEFHRLGLVVLREHILVTLCGSTDTGWLRDDVSTYEERIGGSSPSTSTNRLICHSPGRHPRPRRTAQPGDVAAISRGQPVPTR